MVACIVTYFAHPQRAAPTAPTHACPHTPCRIGTRTAAGNIFARHADSDASLTRPALKTCQNAFNPRNEGSDNRTEKHARCRPRADQRGICEPRRPYTIFRSKSGHLLNLRSSEKKGGAGMGGTGLGSSPADPAGTSAWLVADRDLSEVDPRGLPSQIRRIRILAPEAAISFASSCAIELEAVCVGRLSWAIDYNGSTGSGASSRHRRGLTESLRRSHHG